MILLGIVSITIIIYGLYINCIATRDDDTIKGENENIQEIKENIEDKNSEKKEVIETTDINNNINNKDINNDKIHDNVKINEINDNQVSSSVVIPADEPMEQEELIEDLWSSYDLEKKYNEMKNKKGLQDYLNLDQWKTRVRNRFSQMMKSNKFKSSPSEFINLERNKRAKDEYAVVEDTALNLLEYYELVSSQDRTKIDKGIIPIRNSK